MYKVLVWNAPLELRMKSNLMMQVNGLHWVPRHMLTQMKKGNIIKQQKDYNLMMIKLYQLMVLIDNYLIFTMKYYEKEK